MHVRVLAEERLDRVGVGLGGVLGAAEDPAHRRERPGVGVEDVAAGVVDERADRARVPDRQDGGDHAAHAEPGDGRAGEVQRLDQGGDVVGEQAEGQLSPGVAGPSRGTLVRRDDVEAAGQQVQVAAVGERGSVPHRAGADQAAVEEHEVGQVGRPRLDVVDVDAVRVDGPGDAFSGRGGRGGRGGHGVALGSARGPRIG